MRKHKKYLDFIRKKKCIGCLSPSVVAHHIRKDIPYEFSGGTSLKPNDLMTVAVCERCHYLLHAGNLKIDGPQEIIRNLVSYIRELEDGDSRSN